MIDATEINGRCKYSCPFIGCRPTVYGSDIHVQKPFGVFIGTCISVTTGLSKLYYVSCIQFFFRDLVAGHGSLAAGHWSLVTGNVSYYRRMTGWKWPKHTVDGMSYYLSPRVFF